MVKRIFKKRIIVLHSVMCYLRMFGNKEYYSVMKLNKLVDARTSLFPDPLNNTRRVVMSRDLIVTLLNLFAIQIDSINIMSDSHSFFSPEQIYKDDLYAFFWGSQRGSKICWIVYVNIYILLQFLK